MIPLTGRCPFFAGILIQDHCASLELPCKSCDSFGRLDGIGNQTRHGFLLFSRIAVMRHIQDYDKGQMMKEALMNEVLSLHPTNLYNPKASLSFVCFHSLHILGSNAR